MKLVVSVLTFLLGIRIMMQPSSIAAAYFGFALIAGSFIYYFVQSKEDK